MSMISGSHSRDVASGWVEILSGEWAIAVGNGDDGDAMVVMMMKKLDI